MEACRLARIPLITYFRGYDASVQTVIESHLQQYRQLFEQAVALVAVSPDLKRRLCDMGAAADKVVVNPSGVDCERFTPVDPAANPPDFLAVGRFVEKKAPHLTLIAFAEAFRGLPEMRLRMIGDGPLMGACRDLAHVLGVGSAVTFLGEQSHDVVRDELRRSRAFVQHSVVARTGDSEGTPNSVMEAGASGLPVIATRHAGIPDVVIEGKTGLLVDERDVAGMAAHMRQLAAHPEQAATLGAAARRHIAANYTMEQSIARLWKIIESAIAGETQCIRAATFAPDHSRILNPEDEN